MPLCTEHGHMYGEGCKCPSCEQVIHVPIPEGDHNPEISFLEAQRAKEPSADTEPERG
jgi:hypothetical protein